MILVYLHIRKTGGMTLGNMLAQRRFSGRTASLSANDLASLEEEWRRLPGPRRERVGLVRGHFPYGVHTFLPRPAQYITMLRHPVDRFISHFYYGQHVWNWPHHRLIVDERLTLADWIERPEADFDLQTRMIAGPPAAGEPEDALERAMLHLERFAFTGLMERFDESVLLLARRFGWRNVFYARVNTNRRRPTYADTPARLRAAIEERSADDMALYRFAAERFEAMHAAAPIPPYVLRGYAALNQLLTVGASLRRQGELLSQRLRHAPARPRD